MPLLGIDAVAVWNVASELKSDRCTFPRELGHLHVSLNSGRLYVAMRYRGYLNGQGERREANVHMTILTVEHTTALPSTRAMHRAEDQIMSCMEEHKLMTDGDIEPLYVEDIPHRAIITVHVMSVLHQRLFCARNMLLQSMPSGVTSDRRLNFHVPIDQAAFFRISRVKSS